MTKVYIIVDACSGENYSQDDPTVLFISSNYEDAANFFDDEISNWEDGMINYDANRREGYHDTKFIYECTDFEGDSHRILKLVEKEIE